VRGPGPCAQHDLERAGSRSAGDDVRLNLFSRLFLGYFFLLILASGMSVYSIMQLGNVMDVTRSIIMVDNSLISLQKEMTDALLSETRYEKKYLIVRDRALYRGFLKSQAEFEHTLSQARALGASAAVQEALNNADDLHLIYWSLFKEEAEYLKPGLPYNRAWYAKEKERAVNAAMQELVRVRLLSQESIYDKVKDLSETGRRAQNVAMAVSAAMLLFGLLLAVWITRSITRPLKIMQKKTRDIADGVFEADLRLPSPPEIGELAQAFNTMSSKLKEVDRMKSDFFSLMSHELRTPLTSIKEGTNLFLEGCCGEVTDKQKKILLIMAEESNRLIGLVNSVLDLSKLESGMLAFNFAMADLPPLITRVVEEVGPLAEAKRIRITRGVGYMPPLNIDTERMLQVLRNLIGNALKFTPRGGMVNVTAFREEKSVLVSVRDTGPGIPREHATAIFDKFRQIPGTGRLPGTGLGLAIVKHIIQAHGGSVWVESEVGKGSTFIVRLPA
jgi:signal transduction histidine kinase